jgi:hypothetical protein
MPWGSAVWRPFCCQGGLFISWPFGAVTSDSLLSLGSLAVGISAVGVTIGGHHTDRTKKD